MSLDSEPTRRPSSAAPSPGAARTKRRRVLLCAASYLVLWLICWHSSRLLESDDFACLWFLPAGLRFFCLLALGWAGVLLELATQSIFTVLQITSQPGGAITEVLSTTTLWRLVYVFGMLIANALVALPLRRRMRNDWDFTRPAHCTLFIAAALAASMFAALAGTLSLTQLDVIEQAQFPAVFQYWMIGDFIGIITLTPLLLVRGWPRLEHYLQTGQWDRRQDKRTTGNASDRQTLLIVGAALALFAIPWRFQMTLNFPLIALFLLAPLAAVALRCGQRGTLLAVPLLEGGLALLITLFDQQHQALHYQVVMVTVALIGLWFGGAVESLSRSEAARRASERSFRATFDQAATGIAMVSPDGRVLRANRMLSEIVGYPLDELQRKTVAEITHPDDLDIDLGRVLQLLSGERQTYAQEKRYRRRDGSFVWIHLTVSLVRRNDGSADYFVAVIDDIQSRKEAELALQLSEAILKDAQRLAGVGNWRWEASSGKQTWSPEMYRIFGHSPALPPLTYADLERYLTAASWADLSAAVDNCLAQGTPYACDAELVRADGSHHWITARGQAVRADDGRVVELNGTVQDITLLKQSAEALRDLNASLEQRVAQRTAELDAALQESLASRQRLQAEVEQHRLTERRLQSVQTTLNRATRIAALGAWSIELLDLDVAANNPITWSAEMYQLLDFTPDELPVPELGRFFARVHPDDRQALQDFSIPQRIAKRTWQLEYRLLLDDGRERLLAESAEVIFDAAGKPVSIHGAVKDITEQRQIEARLRQYRDHLEEMVAERTDKLALAAAEQRRLNRALRLLSDCNIALVRAADEQQLLDELCRLVVDSGGYLMGWVGFAQHDAGKSVQPIAHSGDPQGVLDGLRISWDADQDIGRGPTGTAIRTATTQLSQNCQTSANIEPWREAAIAHGVQSVIALPIVVDNEVLGAFMLYSAAPQAFNTDEVSVLEELSGNLSYGLQALRARRQIEAHQQHLEERVAQRTQEIAALNVDLAEKAADAQAANRAKSTFLSTMSHEIRTPLNAVIGLSGLLADSVLTRSQRDYSDKILLAAQTLAVLIDDVLDFSQIEAGAFRLELAPFSLDAIFRTTAAVLSVGTRGKPIEALFDIAPGIPDRLIGDAMRVQQILINLVGNAVKFTETGEIAVSVRCLAQSATQVTLRFSVRDTGIGIPREQLKPIFEAFAQAHPSTNRLYGGTGLGLTISARLAALMGSHIEVASVEGDGSEIGFTVALERAADAGPATDSLPGLRVLIIDDHPLARAVLARACADFGWQAKAVDSAAAGLDALRQSAAAGVDFDLLLVDWRMPEIDGIEMLRQANEAADIRLPLVVLMVPTFELEQAVAACDDLYLDSLLSKPTTPLALLEAVTRAHSGNSAGNLPPPGRPSQRLAGMRLLVAEDNDLNQLVVEQMLTRAGAEVVVAANGLAAVEALRPPTAHFDAVLMDIQMPVMDGYTATRIIRDELGRHDLPIIAVSAYARPEDREKSRRSGMAGHIVKPIAVGDLLDIVRGEARNPVHDRRDPAATAAACELPGVDLATALKAFGNDRQKYGSILRQFVVDHANDIAQARRLFDDGDRQRAASLVHDLRGMASMVRAMEMAHLAAATEGAIGKEDQVPALFDELEAAMNVLAASIDQIEAMAAGNTTISLTQSAVQTDTPGSSRA